MDAKPSLNWDDLRFFLAIVDGGSVSAAARTLAVEHTTVTRRIDALEASLAIHLFDRLPKAWSLTDEGERLIAAAREAEAGALAFAREAYAGGELAGKVCVSGPPFLLSHLLIPRMRAICAALPGIDIEFLGEAREANLTRREADIALRLQRPKEDALAARPLASFGFGLYATADYLRHTDQEDWKFIGYDESLTHTPQQRWIEQLAGTRRFVLRANDMASLLQAAQNGLGVAALPTYVETFAPALVRIEGAVCPEQRTLWMVMHEDVRRSPRVRALADALGELLPELLK